VRVCGTSDATALALHVVRRSQDRYLPVAVPSRPRAGSIWREVAARLSIAAPPSDPATCAARIAEACVARRAMLIAPLPPQSTWDRAVAAELARLERKPLVVLVSADDEADDDLASERFEVGPSLGDEEKRRWLAAVATQARTRVATGDLASLEAWWTAARRIRPSTIAREAPEGGHALLAVLGLSGRAWPVAELERVAPDASLGALDRAGAVVVDRGWVALHPAWSAQADTLGASLDAGRSAEIAASMEHTFQGDPWAHQRAAELWLRAARTEDADAAHARAVANAGDGSVRREIVARWLRAVDGGPAEAKLELQSRAAERALEAGEADEAFGWAKAASALFADDARVTLLLGRAAVAVGDLVTARVALERGDRVASDVATRALVAVERAEIAYLTGDHATAEAEARRALELGTAPATALRARNTMGKLLLAAAQWDQAERHFAEDTWTASRAALPSAELRARLNRAIAVLSRGQLDEARAMLEQVLVEGERAGEVRAAAFAAQNLGVVAVLRHEYDAALALFERAFQFYRRLGDRLATANVLLNLAELRRMLGVVDHAQHAVAFGRRTLGPGMPPHFSSRFAAVAALLALDRGDTETASREAEKAIADAEDVGKRDHLGEHYRIAARIALEDGDVARAQRMIERASEQSHEDGARAEVALLRAELARAQGTQDKAAATEGLALARAAGSRELVRDAHALLARIHHASGDVDAASAHLSQALSVRAQVAGALPAAMREAYLARRENAVLDALRAQLAADAFVEPTAAPASLPSVGDDEPRTLRRVPRGGPPRELVGEDPAVRGLRQAIQKVARTDGTILVRGESGTGKELVAEALHRASERANGPFVAVNCAALVETLLLSELFGHEKGAFTGAAARRRGRFELAEGGTLFLDEIGDISPRTQVALLRVLQERTFERVGGTTSIRANVRIVCATHRDLRAMVDRGEFREDLYYRLRDITLEIPALRARLGDLPAIATHLLARIAAERNETPRTLAPEALELLARHRWPGNVRELENALRAASLFAETPVIGAADLAENVDDLRALATPARPSAVPLAPPSMPPSGLTVDVGADDDEEAGAPLPPDETGATAVAYACIRQGSASLGDLKRQIERDCIARALAETRGNITRAAALLGMKRPRLSQLVKQYGLAAVSSNDS
jgi:DNA-binding NtrC family response regulator/tetratricopeptide (TPR) repeat protein